ncbi:hypothetical protein, partial [uncultured Muribaculum sp.]|uniref:hypothetical protein n=1 Tax=uncultured Muribaculum sp. TaxID=1918613 RepID=UPI00265E64A2
SVAIIALHAYTPPLHAVKTGHPHVFVCAEASLFSLSCVIAMLPANAYSLQRYAFNGFFVWYRWVFLFFLTIVSA